MSSSLLFTVLFLFQFHPLWLFVLVIDVSHSVTPLWHLSRNQPHYSTYCTSRAWLTSVCVWKDRIFNVRRKNWRKKKWRKQKEENTEWRDSVRNLEKETDKKSGVTVFVSGGPWDCVNESSVSMATRATERKTGHHMTALITWIHPPHVTLQWFLFL